MNFNKKVMHVCGGYYSSKIVGVFSRPLNKASGSFEGIDLLSMEDCAQSNFLGSCVLVILYLCFRFCIFDKPILEEYVF